MSHISSQARITGAGQTLVCPPQGMRYEQTRVCPTIAHYCLLRYGQLDNELRAARRILLHADPSLVLGDDAADDGQTQSRAAFARRKIRVEDALAVFRRDARAGVGDDQFQALAFGDFARDDGDAAVAGGLRHGLRRVVDEVHQRAFDLFAVDHHDWELWRETRREPDAVQALVVELQRIDDHFVQRSGLHGYLRQSRKAGELID